MKHLHFDDYNALEADVCLTSILYNRVGASQTKLRMLQARIYYLKKKILGIL